MRTVVNQTTSRVLCPFCDETIYTTDDALLDADAIEEAARDHLVEHHPIRRRLHRKIRRAMRLTPA